MPQDADSSLSRQQQGNNFKMVLVNNKPMHSWYNWLTAAGVTEDQVEVGGPRHCLAAVLSFSCNRSLSQFDMQQTLPCIIESCFPAKLGKMAAQLWYGCYKKDLLGH